MTDSVKTPFRPTDWEIRDQILLGRELGRGSYGRVLEGEWKGAKVAVKMVHDIFVEVGLPSSDVTAFLSKFEAEWETMKSLRHPNVLQLFGVSNPRAKQAKMVMELMDESLEHRIEQGPALSSSRKLHVLKSIACGLRYLHELPCPVIHRDLASKNILLSRDAVQVKLGDLGVAKFLTELHTGRGTVMPRTELYMPPEARSEMLPHPSLDIFSFGVVMIETIIGQLPSPLPLLARDPMSSGSFRVLTELERREKDVQKVPKDHPLHSVILLALDLPEVRPSAAQVLESLSNFKEKLAPNDNDSASDSSELLACQQKMLELEADKERAENQNRELIATVASQRNEIEQLLSEVATLKARNVQLSQQVEVSNSDQHPVDQPDAPQYIGVAQTPDPTLQLDLSNSRYNGVRVDGHRLTYTGSPNSDVGVFQSLVHSIGSKFTYYQVQVVNYGTSGMIGVGLAHKEYPLNRQPGWNRGSIGYHCDDGRLFCNNVFGQYIYSEAQQGDIIGCGVSDVILCNPCKAIVFFTHNGVKLGEMTFPVPEGGLYPTVGLHSQGEVIDIDFESKWSDSSSPHGMNRLRHELVYVEGDRIAYVGNQAKDVGVFQVCDRPMNHSFSYYEVTVVNNGSKGTIAVGLASCDYPLESQPGWKVGSVAYHCDDGKLYMASGRGQKFYMPSKQGDVIGCGIFSFHEPDRQATVFFTHNDTKIGTVTVAVPHRGLFPTVGLQSAGEVVKVDVDVRWNDRAGSLFSASDRYKHVQVADNTIRYVENWRNEVGVFQSTTRPVTLSQPYFEVRIVEVGAQCTIGVGIARKNYPLNMQPGWCRGSVAHHCDDGKLFNESGFGQPFYKAACKGDVIGCGILSLSQQAVVFFTRNGMKIGETTIALPSGGFYPTVGLHSRGEVVQINFAAQWVEKGVRYERVQVNGDRISFNSIDQIQIGCFQALGKSMNDEGRYFEVEIVNCGPHGHIGIGVAHPDCSLREFPGWATGSIGYHCDDGKLYEAVGTGRAFHSPSKPLDVIGCGVSKIIKSDPRTIEIFFTKNGVMMGQATVVTPVGGFSPIVGFYQDPGTVRINLTATGPVYAPVSVFSSERIRVQGNRFQYAGDSTTRVGCYQLASHQLDSQFSYFEMTIVSSGSNGASGIGVTYKGYPLNSMPGWLKNSVGFHGDDGQLFCGVYQGQPFHSPAKEGDVIGCGLKLSHGKPRVFFTCNGTKVGEVPVNIPDGGFYPTIGMHDEGEEVDVNFSVIWREDNCN